MNVRGFETLQAKCMRTYGRKMRSNLVLAFLGGTFEQAWNRAKLLSSCCGFERGRYQPIKRQVALWVAHTLP